MNEFPPEVIEELGYYVYILKHPDNNQVFYVGKGKGNRVFHHAKGIQPQDNQDIDGEEVNYKLDTIRSILSENKEVSYEILRHKLTEDQSIAVEATLIDFLRDELTNIVRGHGADYGRMSVREIITKYKAVPAKISEKAILIRINRSYDKKKGNSTNDIDPNDLYEITRGDWAVGDRRNGAEYAFSIYNGIIKQVYKIIRWEIAPTPSTEAQEEIINSTSRTRWRFIGEVDESKKDYIDQSVLDYTRKEGKKSSQNPIIYVNC